MGTREMTSNEELIASHIQGLEESVAYYSPKNKTERERWVAERFFENLNLAFHESELTFPKIDPPDFIFKGFEFEIKEILDKGRKRHDEYKAELARAKTITNHLELYKLAKPINKSLKEIAELCYEEAHALNSKYNTQFKKELTCFSM